MKLWLMVLLALSMVTAQAVDYRPIVHAQNMERFGCTMPNMTYRFAGSSAPGQVFYIDEPVNVSLVFTKNQDQGTVKDFGIDIQEITQREPISSDPNIAGVADFGTPDLMSALGAPVSTPISVTFTDDAEVKVEIENLPVPKRGGYFCAYSHAQTR